MDLDRVFVDDVVIGERHRALDESKVASLVESIKVIGLQTPISVHIEDDQTHLVAGLHRLEAAKRLGWEFIDASILRVSEIDRELWEIAENLHRVDLTKEQRDEHVRRYAELIEAREKNQMQQDAAPEIGYKKPPPQKKGTARRVAEETGLSVDTVRRALNPAPPKPAPTPADPLNDYEAVDKQVARLMSAWNAAGKEAREQFMAKVDQPVMGQQWLAQ